MTEFEDLFLWVSAAKLLLTFKRPSTIPAGLASSLELSLTSHAIQSEAPCNGL
jgi:hypothetical protein